MISLTRRFPAPVLNEACGRALGHDAFRYRTLVALCKRIEVPQRPLFTDTHELIRPLSEYQRMIQPGDEE